MSSVHYPAMLLLEGRTCLVVGGGRVAARKVGGLLAAGARVRVVGPTLCDELRGLLGDGRVTHSARPYAAPDMEGCKLVFAATDDGVVNQQVLTDAARVGCLCCAVDGQWTEGDFVTPATARRNGLTVAVSTGGRSCRQSRLVKQSLDRHMVALETADLLVMGTSHAELSLGRREQLQPVGDGVDELGAMIMQVWGVHEFALLITCNRIELIAVASEGAGVECALKRLMALDRLQPDEVYIKRGFAAYAHLGLVAGGLLSQSPGEYHVAAQLKQALAGAVNSGWAGGMIQEWASDALHLSKHIKNEITPHLKSTEVETLALRYVDERLGSTWSVASEVLVVGGGTTGRGLVRGALERVARCTWCYHATRPEIEPAWHDRVRVVPQDELTAHLKDGAVIFCAASAPQALLTEAHAPALEAAMPVTVVDLGVPRNVSPALGELVTGLELVDLDRLKQWGGQAMGLLDQALGRAHDVILQHCEHYEALLQSFQGRNKTE